MSTDKHINPSELEHRSSEAVELLKAISNEHRLKILCLLVQGEKNVGELDAVIDLGQSALSQHLAVLRKKNLVKTRKVSQTVYYSIAGQEPQAIMETLYSVFSQSPTPSLGAKS